jgi:hypothetical protein
LIYQKGWYGLPSAIDEKSANCWPLILLLVGGTTTTKSDIFAGNGEVGQRFEKTRLLLVVEKP